MFSLSTMFCPTTKSATCKVGRNAKHAPARVPSPVEHAPWGQGQGQKRALVCGVVYKGMPDRLGGCIRDAESMKSVLIERFNFPESSVRVLTEKESDPQTWPTRHNMLEAMKSLVQDCQAGDSLFFYYSGHGSYEEDQDGDEQNGFDELLCPLDYKTEGMILDDEINTILVNPLPTGVKLHAIIDACHSATVLDLPYRCKMNRKGKCDWKDHRPRNGVWKGTNGGEVFSFSGCKDSQFSKDGSEVTKNLGALTFSFIKTINEDHNMSYGDVLKSIRFNLRLRDIKEQEPQLTSNLPFDVYKTTFSL